MTNTTDTLAEVRSAKSALEDAERNLMGVIKSAIREGLIAAFENPSVRTVVFGVSTEPYNDENMGCGVYGPLANAIDSADDLEDYHALYNLFGYGSGSGGSTGEVRLLADVIKTADWDNVGPALGLPTAEGESYGGREVLFVAERSDSAPGGYLLTEHDQGY